MVDLYPTPCCVAPPTQQAPRLILFAVLCCVAVYFGLHDRYIPDNSDDGWTTSFAYNYFYGGNKNVTASELGGGLRLFGYTYGLAQKLVLDAFGWTRSNAILLSTFFLFCSLPVWWAIGRHFGFSRSSLLFFCLSLPLWEPLFRAANTARPDSLCFTLSSLALLLALKSRLVLSGLAAGVAFEVHQMGALAFLYVAVRAVVELVRIWRRQADARLWACAHLFLRLAVGVGLGLGYYLYFHFDALQIGARVVQTNAIWGRHYFFDYFFITKSYRHLPEFGLILLGLLLFMKTQRKKPTSELLVYAGAALLFGFVMPRSHSFYALHLYVWCVALWVALLNERAKTHWLLVLCLCLTLPQYAYMYYRDRDFSTASYIAAIKTYVQPQGAPIVGSGLDWFAFMDQEFHVYSHGKLIEEKRPFLYIQRNDAATASFGGLDDPYLKFLSKVAMITKEKDFTIYRWSFSLYRISPTP